MHVAFLNRSYYPDTSATGQLLTELCETLVENHGCRVSVVAGVPLLPADCQDRRMARGVFWWERHRGVEVLRARGTRFSKRRFTGRFTNYVTYFASAAWAGLRLDRPDVIVALTDPPIIGLAGLLAARRFRAPFVMSYRDVFPEAARLLEDFRSGAVDRVLEEINRFLVARADRVVALGETMRRRLVEGKGADPQRTVVIPDWADGSRIVPGPKDNPFTRAHDLVDEFVLMHSGNVGLAQNLAVLLDVAGRLREVPQIRVVIVGEGVKKDEMVRLADEKGLTNVLFLPFQPKESLAQSFAAADAFFISLMPGLAGYIVPSKVYGTLAAGRPYVAAVEEESEVAGIAREHGCGLVAPPDDPDAIARAVLELYHDRQRRLDMGRRARLASRSFERPRLVAAYHDLLRALCDRAEEAWPERPASWVEDVRMAPRAFTSRSLHRFLMRIRPAPAASVLKRILKIRRSVVYVDAGRFLVDPVSRFGVELTSSGAYEPRMREALERYLRPGATFVDLGASEGYFTVVAASLVGPAGRVVAVEPQRRAVPILRRNLALNGATNVTVVRRAVANGSGHARLHLAADTNNGSTSLFRSTRYPLPVERVRTTSLTELLDSIGLARVDLMKIDIEGAEYEAVLGSPEVFRDHRVGVLALELHPRLLRKRHRDPAAIERFLQSCGYERDTELENAVWVAPDAGSSPPVTAAIGCAEHA